MVKLVRKRFSVLICCKNFLITTLRLSYFILLSVVELSAMEFVNVLTVSRTHAGDVGSLWIWMGRVVMYDWRRINVKSVRYFSSWVIESFQEIDCFFGNNRESVECKDGKCQCADGFYQRFTNVCRRESISEFEAIWMTHVYGEMSFRWRLVCRQCRLRGNGFIMY